MSTQNINNLVELFFIKYKEQKKDNILLTSLKDTDNNFKVPNPLIYDIKQLTASYDHLIRVHEFCFNKDEIYKYAQQQLGECKLKSKCISVNSHVHRRMEITEDEKKNDEEELSLIHI